jgi:hypothetical protein
MYGNFFGALLLAFGIYAWALVGTFFLFYGLFKTCKKQWKGIYFIIAFIPLIIPYCYMDVTLKRRAIPVHEIDLLLTEKKEFSSLSIHETIRTFDDHFSHHLAGEIILNIKFPNNRVLSGNSKRISVSRNVDNTFRNLQVFFEPNLIFYKTDTFSGVNEYFKQGGQVIFESGKTLHVKHGPYILKLSAIPKLITLQVVLK